MKILLFSDIHWSTTSSIIKQRSEKYSLRLEHLIDTMNWVNQVATDNNCTAMICAGDFFDKPQATDEEITALREIKWNNLPCYFLCGNHESSVLDLRYSSLKMLESEKHFIISDQCWSIKDNKTQIHFVPYIVESDRQTLKDYLDKDSDCDKHIIISHNDIAGINYGGFESKIGFSINEIEENCNLYLNGHLHNSEHITDKILNIGSTSAHNFTNDSSSYKYGAWILDTSDLSLKFLENPYAFNFYKIEVNSKADFKLFNDLNNNAVCSIKCNAQVAAELKEFLPTIKNIIESRIIITKDTDTDLAETDTYSFNVDHIAKFIECARSHFGADEILETELSEICK